MANEVFISPGVFTREIDQSFLPAAVGEIGAAIIGFTKKGPAFIPTKVANFSEFRERFGGFDVDMPVPYCAYHYLRDAVNMTAVRVLGLDDGTDSGFGTGLRRVLLIGAEINSGFIHPSGSVGEIDLGGSGISGSLILAELREAEGIATTSAGIKTATNDNGFYQINNNDHVIPPNGVFLAASKDTPATVIYANSGAFATGANIGNFLIVHKNNAGEFGQFNCSLNPASPNYLKKVFPSDPSNPVSDDNGKKHWVSVGRVYPWAVETGKKGYANQALTSLMFQSAPLTAKPIAYQVDAGNTSNELFGSVISGSGGNVGKVFGSARADDPRDFTGQYVTARTPTILSQPFGASGSGPGTEYELFYFQTLDDGECGNTQVKVELRNPVERTLDADGTDYPRFDVLVREWGDTDLQPSVLESFGGVDLDPESDNYIGKRIGDEKWTFNSSNKKAERQGSPYGTNIQISKYVRVVVPTPGGYAEQSMPWGHFGYPMSFQTGSILQFGDPGNHGLAEADDYTTYCTGGLWVNEPFLPYTLKQQDKDGYTDNRVTWGVEWDNLTDVADVLKKKPSTTKVTKGSTQWTEGVYNRGIAESWGGGAIFGEGTGSLGHFSLKYISGSSNQETYTATGAYGLPNHLDQSLGDLALIDDAKDASRMRGYQNYFTASGAPVAPSLSTANMKFTVAFYGGFDGVDPGYSAESKYCESVGVVKKALTKFGQTDSTTNLEITGTQMFKRAIDALADDDQYDFKLLFIPGVSHKSITSYASEMVQTRGDALYIMDPQGQSSHDTIHNSGGPSQATKAQSKTQAQSYNTNYAATYYPWIKIADPDSNSQVWVPPTIGAAAALAFNDRVGFPWFAPAGLNRGGLDVLDVWERLDKDDRDDLYGAKVNPIASFPGSGIVIWGQKTLQTKSSALDRINVRRLLIFARKLIASTVRVLVFEPNSVQTRTKFTNLINPILDTIRRNQGIERFIVRADESVNTPDLIDRNILKGKIFIQPTRAAEFISIDFFVTRTGATFEEV